MLEHRRKLEQPESSGLRHRRRRLAFDDHRDLASATNPSASMTSDHRAEAVEEGRGPHDKLQGQV
jgi:hypothetical protein